MNTLEITLQRKADDGWPVVVERTTSASTLAIRSEGVLRLDEDAMLQAQQEPKAYGQLLGEGLFRDAVRDAFVQARGESDETLRVLLCVEDDALRNLRWERLCAPFDGQWSFLAMNQRAPLSLYLPSLTDRRFPPIGRRDLKALVLVANPAGLEKYGLSAFDGTEAARGVRAALGEIPCDILMEGPDAAGPPTLDALCERITAQGYALLHVVCHGRFHPDSGDTLLYLARAGGGVEAVKTSTLIERLGRLQGGHGLPRFAFLCTCESALAEAEGALGGLGQRLVRELGMPAVIAMTEKISVLTAEALAGAFYRQLRQHGEVDRALVEATAGLQGRADVTVPALFSRLGGRPLFSDSPDRALTPEEIKFGLARSEVLVTERAPVLVAQFDSLAGVLRAPVASAAKGTGDSAREERSQALRDLEHLCEEVAGAGFSALAQGREPAAYDGRCPFRGLYPFKPEDREFFCGREALIERLRMRITEHPLLAVLGPSGSGKSSVVLAGLVPRLLTDDANLAIGYCTPTADPLGQLDNALAQLPAAKSLMVIDQFEELFTLCADAARRTQFIDRLLALPERMPVVLTMRADFWGECASHPRLKEAMLAHQELIGPMDAAELRRGMEEQAKKTGLRFEADLCRGILDDVQGEPGAMPLLQHALRELWKRRHGRWLRTDEYRAIGGGQAGAGGVRGAIARSADELFTTLPAGDQGIMREIFVRLTRLDDDGAPGGERRDTRRRVDLEDLVPAGEDESAIRRVLNQLTDARLVVTSRNAVTGGNEVEVAHEALIRYWPRLKTWLDEDRVVLRMREGIGDAAEEWHKRPRDQDLLIHKGARLEEIEKLLQQGRLRLNEQERLYLAACQDQRRAQERRRRTIMAGLATLATIAALAALGANWQARRAQATITTAQGFADGLMFRFLDRLDEIEHTHALRRELVQKVGELHAALGQVGAADDKSTEFWRHVLEGDVEQETGQTDRARAHYADAVRLAERLSEDLNWRRNLSIGYGKLADLASEATGSGADLAAAQQWLGKALALDQGLVAAQPENVHWQRDLSLTHARLGDVAQLAGDRQEAHRHFEASRAIAESLARKSDDVETQRDLAYAHIRLGHWAYKFDELATAREHYAHATRTGAALPPSELDNDQWRRELMTSHKRLGELTLLDEQRLDTARKASHSALELARAMVADKPTDASARLALFKVLMQIGEVEMASREYAAAREALEEAVEAGEAVVKKLAVSAPQREAIRNELKGARTTLAQIAERLAPPH